MLYVVPSLTYTMCVPTSMITYCAARVRSTMEECARHSDNLCLHLSYTREDVWVKWVAPCKISIYLATKKVKICMKHKMSATSNI